MSKYQIFTSEARHPFRIKIRNLTTMIQEGDRVEFLFPTATEADREALIGWAHAMRFFADAILGAK